MGRIIMYLINFWGVVKCGQYSGVKSRYSMEGGVKSKYSRDGGVNLRLGRGFIFCWGGRGGADGDITIHCNSKAAYSEGR